jgi:DNA-binding PadR family transcriptional regulator
MHVLHHAAEAPTHGAELSRELARHGYEISPGRLYPLLHALEREGLVVSGRETRDGRMCRLYRITPAGALVLREGRSALRELAVELLGVDPAVRDSNEGGAGDRSRGSHSRG